LRITRALQPSSSTLTRDYYTDDDLQKTNREYEMKTRPYPPPPSRPVNIKQNEKVEVIKL
jgi:hypothetical protein